MAGLACDRAEIRVRQEKLFSRNGIGRTDGRSCRQNSVKRIGKRVEQRITETEVLIRQHVELSAREILQVHPMRSDVCRLHQQITRKLTLNAEVPLLHVWMLVIAKKTNIAVAHGGQRTELASLHLAQAIGERI